MRNAIGGVIVAALMGMLPVSQLRADETEGFEDQGPQVPAGQLEAPEHGGHHPFVPELGIEFMKIVLDLTEEQAEELEPILKEHREKMEFLRGTRRMREHDAAHMKRMRRSCRCDKVDRAEMRSMIRRDRREMGKERWKLRRRAAAQHEELEKKLSKVLDGKQMEKLRKLRELRESRREEHQRRRGRRV